MFKGFKQFILRGNVIDLAVGVVIGASFNTLVNSFVSNLLTPLIGAIAKSPDFSSMMFTIGSSKFMYGNFLNSFISFLIVAFTIYFFVVNPINKLIAITRKENPNDLATKKCPECLSEIPREAKRCSHCTSVLEVVK